MLTKWSCPCLSASHLILSVPALGLPVAGRIGPFFEDEDEEREGRGEVVREWKDCGGVMRMLGGRSYDAEEGQVGLDGQEAQVGLDSLVDHNQHLAVGCQRDPLCQHLASQARAPIKGRQPERSGQDGIEGW